MLGQLRKRMTLLCTAVTGIILIIMSIVSLYVSERQLSQREEAMFASIVNSIAFKFSTERMLSWTWLSETEFENDMIIHAEDNGSPILFTGSWHPSTDRSTLVSLAQQEALVGYSVDTSRRPRSALNSPQAEFSMKGAQGENYRVAVVIMRTESGYMSLTVLQDVSEQEAAVRKQRWSFAAISLSAILPLLVFSWWFAGRAIRPVAQNQQQQAEFIAAASHELRTPLAVIRTSAAALNYEEDSQDSRFVRAIDRECERTSRLVDDLLLLANADAKGWSVQFGPVEPELILRQSADAFRALAASKGIHLHILPAANPLPVIAGDENRLLQLVSILLDNACHYTPLGGHISLSCSRQGKYVQLLVSDNGPGIPAEQREMVFQRFFRADPSRSKKEHYGLGLSVAKEIVKLHKGKIFLTDTPGGGLTVIISLPASLRLLM